MGSAGLNWFPVVGSIGLSSDASVMMISSWALNGTITAYGALSARKRAATRRLCRRPWVYNHQVRLGRNISKTVARELAIVERAKALKQEAGIGARKRKDISFDKAADEFLRWAEANHRAADSHQLPLVPAGVETDE
jgi:hypothetical protein